MFQSNKMSASLLSSTTFEYAVLALTVLQMLNSFGFYPAASGIPSSLFALVALGIDRFFLFCGSVTSSHSYLLFDLLSLGSHSGSGASSYPLSLFLPISCTFVLASLCLDRRLTGRKLLSASSVEMSRFIITYQFVVQMELCRLHFGTSSEDLHRVFLKNEKFCMVKERCIHVR